MIAHAAATTAAMIAAVVRQNGVTDVTVMSRPVTDVPAGEIPPREDTEAATARSRGEGAEALEPGLMGSMQMITTEAVAEDVEMTAMTAGGTTAAEVIAKKRELENL